MSRRQQNPTTEDWSEIKRIFRYLRGTTELGLIHKGKLENLEAMTNASFRDCSGSTSTCGYVIKLFNDTIAWRSHKQTLVALPFYPVLIHCDNKAAVDNAQKNGCHKLKSFDDDLETIKENL